MFKYEMHAHSAESSKCSKISGADLVDFYHALGYTGIVITDHFFNGNTTVPKDRPWAERVELFAAGYRAAKERGDAVGVDVFFGWEFAEKGSHFLTYGLDADWLCRNVSCDQLPINAYCDLVHAGGGFVVQAHPFRGPGQRDMIRLLPHKVDAVEIINASRKPLENHMAAVYAEAYAMHNFCGSDIHSAALPRLAAIELEFRAGSVGDILSAVMRDAHRCGRYQCDAGGVWHRVDEYWEE